jgi:hypothetical protein
MRDNIGLPTVARRSGPDASAGAFLTAISGGLAITMRDGLETVVPGRGARRVVETVGMTVSPTVRDADEIGA